MQLRWNHKISFKLARTAVIIAFTVGFILSAGQVYLDYLEEGDVLDRKVQESLQVAEKAATRAVLILDSDLAQEVVSGLMVYDYVAEATIMDDLGSVLAGDRRDTKGLAGAGTDYARVLIEDFSNHRHLLNLPDTMAERPGRLEVVIDRAVGLQPFFARATTTFMTGLVRNLLLVLLLYFAFHQGLTKPMAEMAREISDINPEKPGEKRINIRKRHERDELGMLARQINPVF